MSTYRFLENDVSLESQWRSIILLGKNSATYKFAFAKSLLELADTGKSSISLQDLSIPFSKHIVTHLKANDKQGSSSSSTFLNACRKYIKGEVQESDLLSTTEKFGFVNVVDAFQNVNGAMISDVFYEKNYQNGKKEIVIKNSLLKLKENYQYQNLPLETEARWNLVETAWNLNINPNLLEVEYDEIRGEFFIEKNMMRRVDITSARDSLNGYQKGKCFYSFKDISIKPFSANLCHVDHFLPHLNKRGHLPANINGVWNLVLAHKDVNSTSEKGAKVPSIKYLERLHKRNEFFIESRHPLGETILNQTGQTSRERASFLQRHWSIAKDYCIHSWEYANEYYPAAF